MLIIIFDTHQNPESYPLYAYLEFQWIVSCTMLLNTGEKPLPQRGHNEHREKAFAFLKIDGLICS